MICIRNSKNAKIGLLNLISFIEAISDVKTKQMTMAEIGSYVGDSTEIFANNFKTVYAIDPWQNGYDPSDAASYQYPMKDVESQFDSLCFKYPNIIKLKNKSEEAVISFDDYSLDLVYIDGLHTYEGVKKDIELWTKKLKPSGFLCGHDYQGKFAGVIKAVDEFQKPLKVFEDTSWIIRF